jgi:hypothetical protein
MISRSACRLAVAGVVAWAAAVAALPAYAQKISDFYRGMCEASAAVAVGPDHFLVAEDEGGMLRLYARNKSQPVWSRDVEKIFPPGAPGVTDIEGAARIGDRVYWITSHSVNKDGEDKAKRRILFATDIVGTGAAATIKLAGAPYTKLREDMIGDKDPFRLKQAAKIKPKEKGGLSIEGLAAAPDGKGLWIGFRNPIADGKALVVPLENPDDVIMNGAKAKFGQALRPDLDGFGIRSLERVGDRYLIVAGAFDKQPDFTLRQWSGAAGEKPKVLLGLGDKTAPLFTPEALYAIPGTDTVHILSDDGDFWEKQHGGMDCKDNDVPSAQKRFRSMIVKP